jgi:hypothetical protein
MSLLKIKNNRSTNALFCPLQAGQPPALLYRQSETTTAADEEMTRIDQQIRNFS